jgi:hypothetical protein
MQDAQHGESDGSSRGVRALSAFRAQGSITPDCLSGALRSRGFSPPQRFDPPRASWLCFAPHPPLGFSWSSELFPLCQPWRLSAPSALLPFGWLVATLERTRESPRAPGRGMLLAHLPLAERHPEPGALHLPAELDIDPRSCSPKRAGLWARGRDPVAVSTQRQMPSASVRERPLGAPSPGMSPRLQSLAPAERPYSETHDWARPEPMLS